MNFLGEPLRGADDRQRQDRDAPRRQRQRLRPERLEADALQEDPSHDHQEVAQRNQVGEPLDRRPACSRSETRSRTGRPSASGRRTSSSSSPAAGSPRSSRRTGRARASSAGRPAVIANSSSTLPRIGTSNQNTATDTTSPTSTSPISAYGQQLAEDQLRPASAA